MSHRFSKPLEAAAFGTALILATVTASFAGTYDLSIGATTLNVSGSEAPALAINGTVPGPVLRFKEGENLTINVANTLDVDTSIHWHGLILPYRQDGVPGISFDGIKPGETFTYTFPTQQSGTYWYHSHSGLQEQAGVYGAIVIEPKRREPFRYDREYIVVLSDFHAKDSPETILANLKKISDYYNYQQRTIGTFFKDAAEKGLAATVSDRLDWGGMRMTPTDITDVSGYTFLINGRSSAQNWAALFKKDERIRLRFINAAAMTFFDVRIPGLKMTVVQADGQNVRPVPVDEFRIAVAETYDVIVRPTENKAYTLFAESMARTGFVRGTLTPDKTQTAAVPGLRQPPLLTMADMGHGGHEGMDHGQTGQNTSVTPAAADHAAHGGAAAAKQDPFYAAGSGLAPKAADGGKMLSYADLKALRPLYKHRPAGREIVIRLTGNMERYIWTINGKKYSDAEPIKLKYGERARFKFVNETMMTHPMHLHGMWQILDNGSGRFNPAKHTINIAPGMTVYADIEADAEGEWAFHCHLMYHMATGMFRKVIVERDQPNS